MTDKKMSELFAQDDYDPSPVVVPPWLDVLGKIGNMVPPERFEEALQHMPLSTNIEDRRGERYPRRWAVRPQYRAAGER
jgi:hypothetical protein